MYRITLQISKCLSFLLWSILRFVWILHFKDTNQVNGIYPTAHIFFFFLPAYFFLDLTSRMTLPYSSHVGCSHYYCPRLDSLLPTAYAFFILRFLFSLTHLKESYQEGCMGEKFSESLDILKPFYYIIILD